MAKENMMYIIKSGKQNLVRSMLVVALFSSVTMAQQKILWQIGKADNHTAEFALGPADHPQFIGQYPQGAIYIVGQSDPKKDWPYIQPGPADVWANSKSHTFTILFALKGVPVSGNCELLIDLVDTHQHKPPTLKIQINQEKIERQLPQGGGDDSAHGKPEKGIEHKLKIPFQANILRSGNNTVSITTATGSWILYDSITLTTPQNFKTTSMQTMTVVRDIYTKPYLLRGKNDKLNQPVLVNLLHVGEPAEVSISTGDQPSQKHLIKAGTQIIEAQAPAVSTAKEIPVSVSLDNKVLARQSLTLQPVRKWQVHMLHHTHLDIGYTHIQDDVERLQMKFLDEAIEIGRRTDHYPPEARFKWLPECLWPVDRYLKEASPEKRKEFLQAVEKGWISLDAFYGNALAALYRPEELFTLLDYSQRLKTDYGIQMDSAMITDVPGFPWGIVPVMAQCGVKYLSMGPNTSARIGYVYELADQPFYWVSPCGKHKILCWIAGRGYSWFHTGLNYVNIAKKLTPERIFGYLQELEQKEYPYDIIQIRYNIGSDNGPPDPELPDYVKAWNEKYAYPQMIIISASQSFRDFEQRYGDKLPEYRGDFTPYWEDGAASSARETALNRNAAERLVQAATLWAMLDPKQYPDQDFYLAWRGAVLYDEHTWGAYNSISEPDHEFVKTQWAWKQNCALEADKISKRVLQDILKRHKADVKKVEAVDIFNTNSWPRNDLIILPKNMNLVGDRVEDASGHAVYSQRLSTGELAFLAKDVPPLSAKRFLIKSGNSHVPSQQIAARRIDNTIANTIMIGNDAINMIIDTKTGGIIGLKRDGIPFNLVDRKQGLALNDYFYVAGNDPKKAQPSGLAQVTLKEKGPLVTSLLIESEAPGCHKLIREIRMIAGLDRVDIINIVDKKKIRTKEGVHFAFAFNVPDGQMRLDTPWAVVRPELDQIPGSNKNFFTVQRFIDVSNDRFGITCAILDAPMVEVGSITAEIPWIKTLPPTQKFFSYVMNNYWFTNYRADQEGPTTFRYSLYPHQKLDLAAVRRFGIERSQPLIPVPVKPKSHPQQPSIWINTDQVIITSIKPTRDQKAYLLRLFNCSDQPQDVKLDWPSRKQPAFFLSNPAEEKLEQVKLPMHMLPSEIITLRLSM
jgi:alpha-mannosidase